MSRFDAAITFCPTPDLDATARFYENVLGLELALDQGTCRIYRVAGGGFLGFCRSDDPPITRGLILTLVTDDVDGWESRLRAADIEIEAPATLNPTYNIYHVFCRDPNGYRVEIQRFESGKWKVKSRDCESGCSASHFHFPLSTFHFPLFCRGQ